MDCTQITIAFIDDGIVKSYFPDTSIKSYIVRDNKVEIFESYNSSIYSHATTCTAIFLQYVNNPNIKILDIKILDNHKSGNIDDLVTALYWVCEQNVKVINLSLGTIYYKESEKLQRCVNLLTIKGIIIIAAQNNNLLFTYPASFSNVIGVNANNDGCELVANCSIEYDGIDYSAKWAHSLSLYGKVFVTSRSNSFAAPFVTALAVNLCLQKDISDVFSLKRELNKLYNLNVYSSKTNNFDWCVNGFIVYFEKIKLFKEKLNFFVSKEEDFNKNGDLSRLIEQINNEDNLYDTLILIYKDIKEIYPLISRMDELLCTRLVMVNLDKISLDNFQMRLRKVSCIWFQQNTAQREIQCFNEENIEIPVVEVYSCDINKLFNLLLNTRKEMLNDGYNCRCFVNNCSGILYDFSIIDTNFNKYTLCNIIQKRCIDIALIGIVVPYEMGLHDIEPDLKCFFKGEQKEDASTDKLLDYLYLNDNQESIYSNLKKVFC